MVSSKRKHLKPKTVKPLRIITYGLLSLILIILLLVVIRGWIWLNNTSMHDTDIGIPTVKYLNYNSQINLFIKPNWMIGIDNKNKILKYIIIPNDSISSNLNSLSHNLRVVIDGYVYTKDELNSIENLSTYVRSAIYNRNLQTNLSHFQLIQLWWNVRSYMLIQKQGNLSLPEDEILKNNYAISILNGTNQPGLAIIGSEWVENLGTDVIEVGNAIQTYEVSNITVYSKEKNNPLFKRLEKIYNCPIVFDLQENNKPFDVQIIIGVDFTQSGN